MERRMFLAGAGTSALALTTGGQALGQRAGGAEVPDGFTRLTVWESALTIEGKTGRVYRIEGDDGQLGYVGARGRNFRVALENATAESLSLTGTG